MKTVSKTSFLQELKASISGSDVLRGECLCGSDIRKKKIGNRRFVGSRFEHCSFWWLDFCGSSFEDVALFWNLFWQCSFRSCLFRQITTKMPLFIDCDFREVVLQDTSFFGATISTCSFNEADLRGTRFHHSSIVGGAWERANLDGTTFQDVTIDEVTRSQLCMEVILQALGHGREVQVDNDRPEHVVLREPKSLQQLGRTYVDTLSDLVGCQVVTGGKRRVVSCRRSLLWQIDHLLPKA